MKVPGIALTLAGDQHDVFGVNNEALNFHVFILYICLTYTLNSLKIYFLVIHENGQNTLSFSMQLKENVMS